MVRCTVSCLPLRPPQVSSQHMVLRRKQGLRMEREGGKPWDCHPPEGRTVLNLLVRRKMLLVLWIKSSPRNIPWCLVRINPRPGPAVISTLSPLSVHGQYTC